MRIGFLEPFPILLGLVETQMKQRGFGNRVHLETANPEKEYDLLISDFSYYSKSAPRSAVTLISGSARVFSPPEKGILISLGMKGCDTVTLSSILEDKAMLCLQQEICVFGQNLGPFEKPIVFDRSYSLYKNLSAGFALCLAESYFGEEENNDPHFPSP